MTYDKWLKTVCFQKPTKEADDLAKCAWQEQQAKIDRLMLEYCPLDMTQEQLLHYEECQISHHPDCKICHGTGWNHNVQCEPTRTNPSGWKTEKCACSET